MTQIAKTLADAQVLDPQGRTHTLRELWNSKPALIVFLRHFG
jgi:hypothetical protein